MKRIAKAALGGLAGCALVFAGTQAAVGEASGDPTYTFEGPLRDLQIDKEGRFDGAKAVAKIWETTVETSYSVQISGIAPSDSAVTYPSHLHVGKCQKDEPAQTGGHYNVNTPIVQPLDPATEVWFSFTPDKDGTAGSEATATFVPLDFHDDQWMSIVIHDPLQANAKVACLPLDFSGGKQ